GRARPRRRDRRRGARRERSLRLQGAEKPSVWRSRTGSGARATPGRLRFGRVVRRAFLRTAGPRPHRRRSGGARAPLPVCDGDPFPRIVLLGAVLAAVELGAGGAPDAAVLVAYEHPRLRTAVRDCDLVVPVAALPEVGRGLAGVGAHGGAVEAAIYELGDLLCLSGEHLPLLAHELEEGTHAEDGRRDRQGSDDPTDDRPTDA